MYWQACQENFLIRAPVITSADKHALTLAMKFDFPFFSFSARFRYVPMAHAHMYSTPSPAISAWHFGDSIAYFHSKFGPNILHHALLIQEVRTQGHKMSKTSVALY